MSLAKIFDDGMVLQRDREIIVYGVAAGEVKVEFAGQTRSTDTHGPFELCFPALPAGGPYEMKFTEDGKERLIRDILVGDVYVIAGQSNPEMKLESTLCGPETWEADDAARVFHSRKLLAPEAFDDGWHPKTKENSRNWSAIAFWLSKFLRAERRIPILIDAIDCLLEAFRRQWLRSFKSFGLELMQIRLGGLKERYRELARVMLDYVRGESDSIPELEVKHQPNGTIPATYHGVATGGFFI